MFMSLSSMPSVKECESLQLFSQLIVSEMSELSCFRKKVRKNSLSVQVMSLGCGSACDLVLEKVKF